MQIGVVPWSAFLFTIRGENDEKMQYRGAGGNRRSDDAGPFPHGNSRQAA